MTATANEPTLREQLVQLRLAGRAGGRRSRIPAADRTRPLPLSHGQQQMWFLNRMDPTSAEYLVPLPLRLSGPLDVAALAGAWDALVARHEILRTRYCLVDDAPVQVVDQVRDVDLPVVDLSGEPERLDEAMTAKMTVETGIGFDLAAEWPVRATLYRLGGEEHVLLVVLHHIAADAPTVGVLVAELGALYQAFTTGHASPLPPPTVQYADFAAWQRDRSRGPEVAGQLEYWREQLDGLTPVELPADRPRPRVRDWRGAAVPFRLSAELAAALRDLAIGADTTLFVTLLTAFGGLLSRYTGRTDLAVGTVTSARSRPELQNLVGYGIDNLVLRARWTGDPEFAELLAAGRATVLDAFDHQDVPFPMLVDELEPDRDLARTPLYQVAFTMQGDNPVGDWHGDVAVEVLHPPLRSAKVDLTLHVVEAAGGELLGQLEYATALFDAATAERMVDHLVRLLTHVAADPSTRLSEIPLLGAEELAAVTAGAATTVPVTGTVHGAFEAVAARTPDAPAVTFAGRQTSYAELNAAANRLAHRLIALGAGPERLVAVCLDRGGDLIAALLGVLKSGAAYLPLDPASPAGRVDFMLADAGARIVVTTPELRDRFADFDGELVELSDVDDQPDTDPRTDVGPDNLVYVIYTSGSSGRPKGVCLAHANVLRLMAVTEPDLEFGPADVWTLFHSHAFDFSVWELWGPLLHGGRLVVVPREVARAPEELVDLLVAERVTVLNQTPSAFRGLVRLAERGDPRIDALALRAVVFGGERLEFAELAPWVARRGLDAPRLLNMYGITETTVHTTFRPVRASDLDNVVSSPIGHPLADLSVHLLDRHGRPVPVGVPGEIHVGGGGVARGYFGRPGLTAERFVPDPYGPAGSRLYRSGDLARRLADGGLEFLGRIDDQVKIRGYRIELGEIEAAVAALPGVGEVVVVVREDVPGDKQLVAYSVIADGAPPPRPGQLRAALARTLPAYMIPSAFVPLTRIPLTTNGKLDRRALPSPDRGAVSSDRPYVAPRTEVERRLAAVWARVLKLERVGAEDGFFDVGGDSIRAVALAGAMREDGLDVEVRDIFEHRTVAALAELLTGRAAPAAAHAAVAPFALLADADRAALPDGVVDAYPCSKTQLGMLVEMMADTGRNHYHNVTSYRIPDRGEFSLDALREAAALLVRRHDVLRTSFDLTGYSVPMQLVHAEAEMSVERVDVSTTDRDELDRELRAFIAAERTNLFDLAHPSLLRLHAHVCPDGSWWLTLTECHAILDGWSYHSLLMEIVGDYHRIRAGEAVVEPPAPPVRFADAVAAELDSLEQGLDREFWHRTVAGHERFGLPESWADPSAADGDPHERWVPVHDLEPALRGVARTAGVPLKSVYLAAHLKVLSQLTPASAFYTGLVCNGRPELPGADRVYGMHLNTVPFVHDRRVRTWRELVVRTFDRELELWAHRRYPSPVLQRELADGGRMLDVRFSYHDFHQIDTAAIDYADSIDDSPTEFPLGVAARFGFVTLQANRKFVDPTALDRLAGMYRAVLEAMAADLDGDASPACLPPADRPVVLADGPAEPLPEPASVLDQFEARTAELPTVEAVNGVGYAALDMCANQIANALAGRGVGAGSVVGVLVDRGPDLLAALLGVWKAGAAYVPIDPSYPAGRIAGMLADAGAATALTTAGYADRFAVDTLLVEDTSDSPHRPVPRTTHLDELAYVIFTSGSTGHPKGVQVTHRGLANHVRWAARELAGRGSGGSAVFSSVAFDLVVPNVWAPLVAGQRVFMADQDQDLAELGPVLAANGPFSFLKLTPGHLDIIGRQLDDAALAALAPVVVVAGEALPGATANRWLDLLGPGGLVNEYGPTEASVGTCVFPVVEAQPDEVVPIGRALPGMTMYVLDERMELCPVGVAGELYVGGTGVARGYANAPALTAGRFVPDPFGRPGARLYRTGDVCRRRADGAVAFLGRVDHQVKIRGYRVELAEIEAVLEAAPAVRDAVVVVREQAPVAYYVPDTDTGGEVGAEALAAHCAQRLPEYMVPTAFLPVEAIPLNANGKVDRDALVAATAPVRAHVEPSTPLEAELAAIWARVLELPEVSVRDSFFDLGGHSIRAIALVGALRTAGHPVSVRDVFTHRTVAALAEFLAARAGSAPEPAFTPVEPFALLSDVDRARLPAGLVDAYPAAQAQLGMAVEAQKHTGQSLYHNVRCFRVHSDHTFSAEALSAAVGDVVARHETLRTSFDLTGYSVPVQLVHAEAPLTPRVVELAQDADVRRELGEFVLAERATPFAPDQSAPLLRVAAHVNEQGWWLTVAVSHLVTGGWDLNALMVELLGHYECRRAGGQPPAVAPAPVRYADFVAGELAALESAEDTEYWRGVVNGYTRYTVPAGLGAPAGTPRETRWQRVSYGDLDAGLRALASACDASVKAVLHAAHLTVLSRLTTERRFFAGLVCDARPEVTGAERVHGMYINILPFAVERAAGSWRDLVRRTYAREVELWPHRRYPLPAVRRLADAGPRPIDVVFDFTDFARAAADLDDSVRFEAVAGGTAAEFGLQVVVAGGAVDLISDNRVVEQAGLDRIAAMLRAVLEAMVADPDGDACAEVLPAGERDTLLAWGDPGGEPVDGLAHTEFEWRAAAHPDAVAVTCDGDRVSYGELNRRANRLAHHLRSLGVGPEVLVGVCVERSVEQVAAMVAVHKAGGVYLPLDPGYPAERLAFMVADAGVSVLVAREQHPGVHTVLADRPEVWADQPATDPEPVAEPAHGAYAIYTSGSTGRPKGTVVPHRALVNRMAHVGAEVYGLGPDSVMLQKTEIGFDVSPGEVYGPLSAGARVVVARAGGHRDPEYLVGLMRVEGVTTVHFVPSMLPSLLAAGLGSVGSLRSVAVGGEEIPVSVAAAFRAALPWCELYNTYGPAEAAIDVSAWRVGDLAGLDRVPLGVPHPNVRLHVLDEDLRLAPAGAPGELCVGGVGVGNGYLGQPALTADRFVPDPFGSGERLYRTGDAAAWRPDGTVEFLGRVDGQVKLNGVRIELGEVEAALRACPGVTDAVAAIRETGERRVLVGYVTGAVPAPRRLRERLAAVLPDAMVPVAYVPIDEVPRDPNGKVDRRQLPAPAEDAYATGVYVPPAGEGETAMAAVWAEVLGVERVGAEDGFFELGGDSMLAVTLVGALRAAGFGVTVGDVFTHRTVRALAASATGTAEEFRPVEPFAMVTSEDRAALPAGVVDAYPATRAQVGMAVEIARAEDAAPYHIVVSHRVRVPFDAEALRTSVAELVARHDTLRTTFALSGYSVPMQLVHAGAEVPVVVYPNADEHREFLAAERARPFDLDAPAPLLRVAAHPDGDGWWLTLTVSHLVTGGWDLNQLMADLFTRYQGEQRQAEPAGVRYADFVAGELAALASDEDTEYWRSVVTGRNRFVLPAGLGDRSAPRRICRSDVDLRDLDPAVRELATATGVSVKAVLHAAHVKVLAQLTGESRFFTGLVCDARPEVAGAERVHGMYLNTLPFPADRPTGTWRELVARTYRREVELWPHRRYPLPAIQRLADLGTHPIEVVFNYTEARHTGEGVIDTGADTDAAGSTEFPLSVNATGATLRLVSDGRAVDEAGLARLGELYRAVLAAMVADPDADAATAVLPDGERDRLLGWSSGPAVPVDGLAHTAFEARAAACPDAVAVDGISYRELNERANRLAHHLRSLGVGPEVLVGVCVERSVEQVAAMVAVHKAGGVYLPLDPGYPAERLAFMVEDADAAVLVAREQHPGVHTVLIDDPRLWADRPVTDPEPLAGPENTAYIIYTSGSTGRPKGARVPHRALVNRVAHVNTAVYRLGPDSVMLQKTEIGFDVSPGEVYGPLSAGARVVVARAGGHRDPEYLVDLMRVEGVTTVHFVPSMLPSLLAAGLGSVGSLRSVAVGGEEIPVSVAAAFRAALPWCELYNTYGPAEAAIDVSAWRVGDLAGLDRVPLGVPHPNLALHVLDENLEPVLPGVPGELCVGGAGLGAGYVGRPDLTADRFVPDPFGSGECLYRTGDAATWRPDGTIEFLGRVDGQVKLNGVRIELGEVEAALRACPGVTDAVAAVHDDGARRTLVGYLLGTAPGPAELRERLAAVLPDAMVPVAYVPIDEVPRDPNGKVDRRQLPAPGERHLATGAYVAPAGEAETTMAAVWAEVLGVERVGVEDGFFELGGDSMLAVTLVGALRAAGFDAGVGDVFTHRTVRALAAGLGDRGAVEEFHPVEPFAMVTAEDRAALPAGVVDAYPATRAQVGMAVEIAKAGTGSPYHIVVSHRVRVPFDADALRASVAELVARHDTLRTTFALSGYSVPMQLVHGGADVPVTVHPDGDHAAFLAAERARPFDLDAPAPLLRVAAHPDGDGWWLTLTVSHLVTGGWDLNQLMADLFTRYQGEPVTEPAGVRYADFVAGELAALASDEDTEYWRGVVTGWNRLSLPAALGDQYAPRRTFRSTVDTTDLDTGLRELARVTGVSLKAVLHAAHVKVLAQLTAEDRFFTGLVCDARPEVAGAERVHGMHINTLPFPAERPAGSWRELVAHTYRREVELWPHRRYPLPAIQRLADLGPQPVEVVFNYTEARHTGEGVIDTGADTGAAEVGTGATEFPLAVNATAGSLLLVGDSRVVDEANLARLGQTYRAVLAAMVADPDGDATAACLPDGVPDRLSGWSTGATVAVAGLAHTAFEARAAAGPHAVALTCDGRSLSYGELNADANRLAHHLRSLGVGPEVLVGVCADRSVEQVTAMLAVHKAGGVYVPLDPSYPAARLGYLLADSAVPVLLARRGAVPANTGATVVPIDEPAAWAGRPATDPRPAAHEDNACYVIYTSGSTGRPKGAVVTHAGLVNRTAFTAGAVYRLDEDAVLLQKTEIGFDVSPGEIYAALSAGARIVVARPGGHRDPAYLCELIRSEGVTTLQLIPTMLAAALGEGLASCRSLRSVNVGGEEVPVDVARLFLATLPWCELHNSYGPAEASIDVCDFSATIAGLAGLGRVPIGTPHPNLRLHVVDANLVPVPAGTPGELVIGGVGLGRGYLGRPGLTADRFVPDPFGSGERVYRTGDAATWRPDGTIEFLGRIDSQVKLHGVRIELGEVEAALRACPGVADAVAAVRDDAGHPVLAGYVVARPGARPVPVELRDRLRARLPEAMVPAAYQEIADIPRGPNGKVDRRQLPAVTQHDYATGEYAAPAGELEAEVAAVWAEVLGVERVGVDDSFFDLGGDSMLAVTLVGALRAAGHPTTVRDVFAHRTVRGLAAGMAAGVAEPFRPVEPFAMLAEDDRAALPGTVTDAYPVSVTQLGMLLELMASDERAAYHSVIAHQVRDGRPFDAEALRAAAAVVVGRHEVLRTSFDLTGYSVPLQLVHAESTPVVSVEDGRGVPAARRRELFEEFMAAERATPFDLSAAPLLRIAAHRDAEDSWWLTFTVCHAVTEGWSITQLLGELLEVYAELAEGRAPAEPAPPRVRFADFVAAERAALGSTTDRDYWASVVDGRAPFVPPAGWGEPGGPGEPARATVDLTDLAAAVRAFASDAEVSVKSVLLAAHLAVLGQLTPEPAFHTGLVCDARPEQAGADRVHGMYLNSLPFPGDREARTWRELVRGTFAREVELWPHRRYPLAEIQRAAGHRLLHVLFNYQDFGRAGGASAGAVVRGGAGAGATEFALSVVAHRDDIELSARTDAVSRANLDRLAGMYRAVVEAMVADPDGDPRRTWLTAEERHAVLVGWNSSTSRPAELVPDLVAARAVTAPDAPAVDELTYAALLARANRIAHHLRERGAGPERVVGVLLDRGPDLVAALLGAWQAGAAYLPLDPSHPPERVAGMLDDAGAVAVVTTSAHGDRFGDRELVLLDRDAERIDARPAEPPAVDRDPDHLAYVIFTSGSTGRPNGVQISHRALANYLGWAAGELLGDRPGGAALFSSVAFDMVVTTIWAPLAAGRRLWLLPADAGLDELGPRLAAAGPFGFVKLTPGHLDLLASQLTPAQAAALTGLLVVGGEALTRSTCDRWHALAPDSVLLNEYGPTEATVAVSRHPVTGPLAGDVAPIGTPLGGMRTYVLDAWLNPVPVGVVGQVHLGGVGLARGYAGRPELTADRFVPDPFGGGERLYRTGDLGRWLPGGELDLLGRVDDQVKVRGHRVELGEVRAVLLAHPEVRDAVVTAQPGPGGARRLVAYHVGSAGDLAVHCGRTLPPYAVPGVFVELPAIPLNANGKVDHRALPEAGAVERDVEPPRTDAERALAAVWSEVLEVDRIGRDDRFFALGGHSLLTVAVVTAARRAGIPLTLQRVLADPTLAELAAAAPARAVPVVPPLEPVLAEHHVPGAVVAVVAGGELVEVRANGVRAEGDAGPVTPDTVFQVGSISKHVTAVAAVCLADRGLLDLDADVNTLLRSWRLPGDRSVTVRSLLDHSAGLTPTGAGGYRRGQLPPTLLDLLDGRGPVVTPPVRARPVPFEVRELNSHYVVVQQLLEDVTGVPFADLMAELVLGPLEMTGSSFDQAFPAVAGRRVAAGHDLAGRRVPRGWEVRVDLAAAGLWTTAPDLARLLGEIHTAYRGGDSAVLSASAVGELLTAGPGGVWGLGCAVDRFGDEVEYAHRGRTTGYRAITVGRAHSGSGLVALTNGEGGDEVLAVLGRTGERTENM